MTSIARVAILTLALTWTALWCQPSFAQPPSDQASKIQFSYIPPKSLKYLPVFNRVQQFKLLEQLSEFLSPLRLPHRFSMVTIECGFVNAQYQPSKWRIELCYEYVEAVERVAPKLGQPSEFSFEEVVVGGLVGVLLHELGHAVIDMLNIPVFGREEDAADEISTFIALQFSPDVARTIVRGNAYVYKVWYGFGAPAYFDEHGTGLQRYYNSLCIAHGSERSDLFKEFIDKGELPKERAAGCQREYQQVRSAFEKTILPFIDREQMKRVQAQGMAEADPATNCAAQAATTGAEGNVHVCGLQPELGDQDELCGDGPIGGGSAALAGLGLVLDPRQRMRAHRHVPRRPHFLVRGGAARQGPGRLERARYRPDRLETMHSSQQCVPAACIEPVSKRAGLNEFSALGDRSYAVQPHLELREVKSAVTR